MSEPEVEMKPDDAPEPAPAPAPVMGRWSTEEEPFVPLRYKKRSKKDKEAEFDPVMHARPQLFAAPMGLAGLAVAFRRAEDVLDTPEFVWVALGAAAAAVLLALLALYAARLFTRGAAHKLGKDWQCTVNRHLFSAAPITVYLLCFLVASRTDSRGWLDVVQAVFWLFAVPQLAAAVASFSSLLVDYHSPDRLTALVLFSPLASMVAVLPLSSFYDPVARPEASRNMAELGFFFFSFSLFAWLVLSAVLLHRFMTRPPEINTLAATHMIWPAAPAVAALAYRALVGQGDQFWRVLVHISFFSLLVAATVLWRRRFWLLPFEMSWWALTFPVSAVAAAAAGLYDEVPGAFTEALAAALLAAASLVTLAVLAATCRALVRRRGTFNAQDKWGPISMLIVTHGVFRRSFMMMLKAVERLEADPSDAATVAALQKRFGTTMLLLREHSNHENQVFFPFLEFYFQGSTAGPQADHDNDYDAVRELEEAVGALAAPGGDGGSTAPLVATAAARLKAFKAHLFKHLALEEATLSPVNRKFSNFEVMIELGRRIFFLSERHWRTLVPFYLNTLPAAKPRRRFLECLRYIVPERMQAVGVFAYEGCSPEVWAEVSRAVPEIVPRGLPGWVRRW